jgi:predicted CXXCH cytochrome family protein
MTVHRPYQNRRCDACHESKFSQKLRAPAGEICLLCHKIVFEKAAFRHAPAGDGSCLGCHNPHESAEKFLLTRKGQDVCRECHDERDVAGNAAHVAIGTTPCQACHDPHGGENRLFLKTGGSPADTGPAPPAAR